MSDDGDKFGELIDAFAVPPQHALRGYGLGAFATSIRSEWDADHDLFIEESPAGAESSIMISAGSLPPFIPHDESMRRTYITSCAGERGAPRYVSICICSHHAFECTCQKLHQPLAFFACYPQSTRASVSSLEYLRSRANCEGIASGIKCVYRIIIVMGSTRCMRYLGLMLFIRAIAPA